MGFFDKRKKKNAVPLHQFLYSEAETAVIQAHIKRYFGTFESVFHEIVSPDVHLDIAVILPTPERNYHTLVTMGAGAYEMNVPSGYKPHFPTRAEYLITLPPTWDIKNLDDPKNYWPIRFLKSLARLPVTCDTWLGVGHTMSADGDNTPFAENTKLCSAVVTHPVPFGGDCLLTALPNGKKVIFYQMVPIYEDELQFNREHGFDVFEEHLQGVMRQPLDINRKSVVPAGE